jgi:hypothetical protein
MCKDSTIYVYGEAGIRDQKTPVEVLGFSGFKIET